MTRPKVIDCFPFHNELDILEMRLTEIGDAVDHVVLVEAEVNHQDRPKPLYFAEHAARYERWADKIVHVIAKDLPTAADDPDPWSREHAQREWIGEGLDRIGVRSDDVILQSDVDEIPRALQVRNCRPAGLIAFQQRLHCFAVDWRHPDMWRGTVAGTARAVHALGPLKFGKMRGTRNIAPCPPGFEDAGWHMSWLGGRDMVVAKLDSFCHTEISDQTRPGLLADFYWTEGWHVDGRRMIPVDVDESWPRWIVDGHAPRSWFRPR